MASQIHNNTAKVSGGAIYFAGIVNEEYQEEDFVLSNTNFTYNDAGMDGGALFCKGYIDEEKVYGGIGTTIDSRGIGNSRLSPN